MQQDLTDQNRQHHTRGELSPVSDFLASALLEVDRKAALQSHVTGVTSGFATIDEYTGGFQRGNLVLLAARPSMGKTNLALTIALAVAKARTTQVAFFSLGRTRQEVIEWLLCADAGVDLMDLRRGKIMAPAMERLARSVAELDGLPFFIDETSALTVNDIRRGCERLAARCGLSMVVIDDLQLLAASPSAHEASRDDELAEICFALKATAKKLNVPVIVVSQLKRAVNRRRNKRPLLADVRDWGLEQEADLITFLYRDSYYYPNALEPDLAEFIIAKNRGGPTGTVKLRFPLTGARFEPYETEEQGV